MNVSQFQLLNLHFVTYFTNIWSHSHCRWISLSECHTAVVMQYTIITLVSLSHHSTISFHYLKKGLWPERRFTFQYYLLLRFETFRKWLLYSYLNNSLELERLKKHSSSYKFRPPGLTFGEFIPNFHTIDHNYNFDYYPWPVLVNYLIPYQ